jgi:hypothetical protein
LELFKAPAFFCSTTRAFFWSTVQPFEFGIRNENGFVVSQNTIIYTSYHMSRANDPF